MDNINTDNLISERHVYALLSDVYKNGAYSSLALDKYFKSINLSQNDKNYITRLFYGVLEKNVQFDYLIEQLCPSNPKLSVKILLKIGLYLLRYSSVPVYAAVNKTVELAKSVGKGGVSGFINAVLKKSQDVSLPPPDDSLGLSIDTSTPLWLTKTLIKNYDFDFAKQFLSAKTPELTHIRPNSFKISKSDFEQKYPKIIENSTKYGYYVTHSTMESLKKSDFIVQSFASIAVIDFLFDANSANVLDLCAAPGGKSVLMKEKAFFAGKSARIVSCDIHNHRTELIEKYACAVGCDLEIVNNDAAVLKNEWIDCFDFVLCDVPCSGIGVMNSKPDIAINRKPEDIDSLVSLQKNILGTAKNYVKVDGFLGYSTCTVLKKENELAIDLFLKENTNFTLCGTLSLFPHIDNCDGFFAAKLQRVR